MALLALSHSKVEHQLYRHLLEQTRAAGTRLAAFNVRDLMRATGLGSYSTIRRGRDGLVRKLSIERQKVAGGADPRETVYVVYTPEEIFARRVESGASPFPREIPSDDGEPLGRAVVRVADLHNLSRREAQVALCCARGMSNAEIGGRLFISEQTVKFHLRQIFTKFRVRRRGELIARLLAYSY
jgi:DNA-binding CsgD family transcriptional regulator